MNIFAKIFCRTFQAAFRMALPVLPYREPQIIGSCSELANAVMMPYVLETYGKCAHKKLHRFGIAAGIATQEDTPTAGAIKFINAIKELNARMRIPNKLSGIQKTDIPALAKHAEKEANPLYPVPILLTRKELERFYYQVADWSKANDK
jgi:alcohol dehydrogenase class IV